MPTAISTFSGPGGSSLGYERAGFDVRAALDCAPAGFSDAILDTYRANHPDTPLLDRDVREVDGDDLLDAANLDAGQLDLLDGSPPCSPFSGANSQKEWRKHESNTLFDEFIRLVDDIEPRLVIAENVPGLAEGKTKGYFNLIRKKLIDAGPGYHLRVQRINPVYLGAPQHRDRLIFQAVRSDLRDDSPPPIEPTTRPMTIRQAWDGLEQSQDRIDAAYDRLRSSDNYAAYKRIKPGETLSHVVEKGWSHYRLKWTEPARTFTSHLYCLPPDEDRTITIPETKRITSLPDDYRIEAPNWTQAFECCIRCLPPVLNQTVAEHLAEHALYARPNA